MKNKKFRLFIIAVIILLLIFIYQLDFTQKKINYGVSFSSLQAQRLNLDEKETYLAILDDLKVQYLRLAAYWNEIESAEGVLNWESLDWQIKEAEKREVKVILVIGRRVPRWPECHNPSWLNNLAISEQQERVLNLLKEEVNRYKIYNNIIAWQVENEPLLFFFGSCPKRDRNFLKKEIQLVKSIDPRPVIITDSGELSLWLGVSGLSEILGTTKFLITWNPWWGYWHYFFPSSWYYLRAEIAKRIFHNQRVILTELQAEPWETKTSLKDTPLDLQYKGFDLKDFRANLSSAKKAGFDEIYFWGAEWWYWLKKQGDDTFWQEAKRIFNK